MLLARIRSSWYNSTLPLLISQLTTIIKSSSFCSSSCCPRRNQPTNQPPTLKPQNPIPGPKSNIVSSAQSSVAIAEHQELAIKKPQNAYLFTLKGRPNIDQLTFSYLKQFLCQPPSTPCMCGSHANEHPSANILASTQVLTKHITYSWGPLEGILLVLGCSFKFI